MKTYRSLLTASPWSEHSTRIPRCDQEFSPGFSLPFCEAGHEYSI